MVFLVSTFIALPNSIQDSVLDTMLSAGSGGFLILLARLYNINVFLPFIPVIVFVAMIHLYMSSHTSELTKPMKSKNSSLVFSEPLSDSSAVDCISSHEFIANKDTIETEEGVGSVDVFQGADRGDINSELLLHLARLEEENSRFMEF